MSCNLIQTYQGMLGGRLQGVTGQPTFRSQVRYLMHFDGTYTDATGNHVVTPSGNGFQNSTYRFGGGSLTYPGSGVKLALNAKPEDMLGENDFTIELWTYQLGSKTGAGIFQIYDGIVFDAGAQPNGLQLFTGENRSLILGNSRDNFFTTDNYITPLPGWIHIAITRQNDLVCLWVGGQLAGSITVDKWDITASIWHLGWVNRNGAGGSSWINYIDELRVTRGVCVYTDNFTPPTQQFVLPKN